MGGVAADLLVHVGADIKDATSGLDTVNQKVGATGKGFQTAGVAMGAGAMAVVGGLGLAINSAMGFETQMSVVGSVLSAQDLPLMGQLSDLAMELGANTKFSATEGAAAIGELAKAGVPAVDILNGAAMASANLAAAGGIGIPEAANAMANAMNMFGIAGSDASTVADNFAAAANASSADVGDLTMALAQGGPAAAGLGIGLDQTIASLALFSNYGIKGSDAGTSLKTMLASLVAPTGEAATALDGMGFSIDDMMASANPMSYLADKLQTGLQGMSAAQQQATLQTIFGSDAMRVANVLFKEGAAGVDAMTAATNDQGAAQRIAALQMDNLGGAIEQLKGSFETALIIVGQGFTPMLKKAADMASKAINTFSGLAKPFQTFISVGAAAVAGFLALGAAIGIAGPMIGVVTAALGALLGPVLLIAGAVALLYAAWSTNFLGIRDIVSSAISGIVGFLQDFIFYMQMVESTGRIMNGALAIFPASLQNIAIVLATVIDGFIDFARTIGSGGSLADAWDQLTDRFSNPVFMDALKAIPGQILGVFTGIPWGEIGSTLLSGLTTAASAIGSAGEWLIGQLGDLAGSLGSWLADEAGKVDWGGKLSAAAALAGDITGTIVDKLGDLATAIGGWIDTAASAVDWANLASAATDITGSIIGKIGDLGLRLKTWYDNAINSVNWGGMGETIGSKIGSLTTTLAGKAGELISGLTNAITTNWPTIGKVLAGLFLGLPAAIAYLGLTLAPKALEFIQGFITGLGVNWGAVGTWLQGIPGKLLGAMPELGQVLLTAGSAVLNGLVSGFNAAWPTVVAWLGLIGPMIPPLLATAGTWLLQAGMDIFQGLINGLTAAWPTVVAWLSLIGTMIPPLLSGAATWLLQAGIDLLTGIITGLTQQWPVVVAWLALIGTMAIDAVGPLIATLPARGIELISGLRDGLVTAWPIVIGWLGLVGGKALNAVGSLIATLIPRGIELITGAVTGLQNQWPTMSAWLGLLGSLATSAVGSLASTLLDRGDELLQGLLQGAQDTAEDVWGYLGTLSGEAASAVGDLSGALFSAGASLISGLIAGIDSMIGALMSKLGFVTSLIPLGKGPPVKDAVLLFDNGQLIMGGLIGGISSMVPALMSQLGDITDTIHVGGNSGFESTINGFGTAAVAGALANVSGPGGQSQIINQTIYIDAHFDDVEEMVEAGKFVRDLNSTRQLYVGGITNA